MKKNKDNPSLAEQLIVIIKAVLKCFTAHFLLHSLSITVLFLLKTCIVKEFTVITHLLVNVKKEYHKNQCSMIYRASLFTLEVKLRMTGKYKSRQSHTNFVSSEHYCKGCSHGRHDVKQ